ncbi:MAG: hypothetical protein Q9160_000555 [Pyrenula sp. 1 TL-2023]
MQSESTEATHSTSSDQPTQSIHDPSSQHGQINRSNQATSLLLEDGAGSVPHAQADEADAISVSSGNSWSTGSSSSERLSNAGHSLGASSPASRIDHYEKALSSRSKKRGKFAFQIVPSAGSSNNGKSIDLFPNGKYTSSTLARKRAANEDSCLEVLTHILSHLPPTSLSAMSLVSKRFHSLITSPHAWRIAFSRYFPGPDASNEGGHLMSSQGNAEQFRSDKRSFSRVSALASWRSEYILRTRLLRSLNRGKPAQFQALHRSSNNKSHASPPPAVITYNSGLFYPVNHIHSSWGSGLNKKMPSFIHGASEQGAATSSDPSVSKAGPWGLGDFQNFNHFADIFAGEIEYGLGPGNMVGMPNIMDVSQPYGKIYGEACPGGRVFFTSNTEQRGRWLRIRSQSKHELGIPQIDMVDGAICSTWIAKSEQILRATNGLIGMLVGTSNGLVASYALGVNPMNERRFEKGELTSKWVISPGVPIIALVVDEDFNSRRRSHRRVWAAALNALGEVFYLTDIPFRNETRAKLDAAEIEHCAWTTGRTVQWSLLEATRRVAKVDPYDASAVDGSYSPRSSCDAMGLSTEQIIAETKEIETFLHFQPKHFRSVCEGWDMRRRMMIDFGGHDECVAGESIVVIGCGLNEGSQASVRRFIRRKFKLEDLDKPSTIGTLGQSPLLGDRKLRDADTASTNTPRSSSLSRCSSSDLDLTQPCRTEWHISVLSFGNMKTPQITSTAIDDSMFSSLATFEDPLLGMSGASSSSSPASSPFGRTPQMSNVSEIPGQRSRFMAVGTTTGTIFMWDLRASFPPALDIVNSLAPIRVIFTDSPQISCLALSSLYLVHGGNDGLVQAWDPLASTINPIRTLNSRFSSRARRRLVQAQASIRGVGNNYYAAGAITLDKDPTVLRGMVTLGTHLRFWSYSSSAADQYKSSKRRLKRRSQRGSNTSPGEQRFTHTGRGVLRDYIANEELELEREKAAKRKQDERLSGRFGLGLLGPGASEEEMLAYATMLSEEAYKSDEVKRRGSEASSSAVTDGSDKTVNDPSSSPLPTSNPAVPSPPPTEVDADVAEAIRRSLLDNSATQEQSSPPEAAHADIPIRYKAKGKDSLSRRSLASAHAHPSGSRASPSRAEEDQDLDFALQLSLAEEQSREQGQRAELDEEDFPALSSSPSLTFGGESPSRKAKGKGRA